MRTVTGILPLLAMAVILAVCGWIVAGVAGTAGVLLGVIALILIAPQVPPEMAMKIGHATPLTAWQAPAPYHDIEQLARSFGLKTSPKLHAVRTEAPVVFSSGNQQRSAVALSAAACSILSERELRAVLAHEIAHIAADDIGLMRVADILGRITSFVATFGLLLVLFGDLILPQGAMSTGVVWFLALAPTSATLLQLALMRRREYAADEESVRITRDPVALAYALQKIERASRWTLKRMLGDAGGVELPRLLRTHPHTKDRIERLMHLSGAMVQSGHTTSGARK
jgi:heat shock protein HtpX